MRINIILLVVLLTVSYSAKSENIIDLGGFRLWQLKEAINASFNAPFQEFETDNSFVKAYMVDTNAYMVFEYLKKFPENVSSIQLTGKTGKDLYFKNLRLGDKKDAVNASLGPPSIVEPTEDPNIMRYSYENTNYSVEVDDKDTLYSVRIDLIRNIMEPPSESHHWESFLNAVKSKNLENVLETMRPDVEIYLGKNTVSIKKRYSDFRANPDAQFLDMFFNQKTGVLAEIEKEKPEQAYRITDNMGMGYVYKFKSGHVLKEIVFFPFNGEYRVYEIAFKTK